jgi:hypothetical protein
MMKTTTAVVEAGMEAKQDGSNVSDTPSVKEWVVASSTVRD